MAKKNASEENRFAGLNNAEIIFMYYRLKNYKTVLDKNLDKNMVSKQVETPLGIATAIKEVKPEFVAKFKETEYYKTACDIIEKLTPVVSIIEQCDDSVAKLLEQFK
tara:strand:+ start:602 stop:922 length:321 start_codon:yes stop_codon:yes gene_type:complete